MLEKTALRLLSVVGSPASASPEGDALVFRGQVTGHRFEVQFRRGELVEAWNEDEFCPNARVAAAALRDFVSLETTVKLWRGHYLVTCRLCGQREKPTLRVRSEGNPVPLLELCGKNLFGGLLAGVVHGEVPIEVLADRLEEEGVFE